MKAISNYIAALITVAMIFTTIAFFVTTSTRQIQVSNYALNTMVEISDRAREGLAVNTLFLGNRMLLSIVNKGTIDVRLSHIVFITKNMRSIEYTVNATIVPVRGIVNLNYTLPVPRSELYDILITTARGNVFSALYSAEKPLTILIIPSDRAIRGSERFNLTIIIINNIDLSLIINPNDINITFIKGSIDVSRYFGLKDLFPDTSIELAPGEQIVFQYTYEYSGGVGPGIIDLNVIVHSISINGEELYGYSHSTYLFEVLS